MPVKALKNTLKLKAWPDNKVCARNILDTERMINTAVIARSPIDRSISQIGTTPADRRAIMATGAVRGKRLRTIEMTPLGALIRVEININGMIIGMIIMVVA